MVSADQIDALFECRFQVLTPPGPGAVAVIQLTSASDSTAIWLRSKILRGAAIDQPDAAAHRMSIGRICYGRWNGEDLIIVRTSESTFEIQCHGGSYAIDCIRHDLLDAGAIEEMPRGKQSSRTVQKQIALAVERLLTTACSRKIAGLILAQTTNSLCDDLTRLKAPDADSDSVANIRLRLARWKNVADHLSEPWRVVLAGAPNVGKSSLINAIAGIERSIVFDQPGTTRDIVEVNTLLDGWAFRFVDTAGIREDGDAGQIESLGIEQSYLAASECDVLCLVVDDRSESQTSIEGLMSRHLPAHTIIVRNKCDIVVEAEAPQISAAAFPTLPWIDVSASTGHGLPALLQWIKLAMVPEEPCKNTAIPILPV